MSLQDRRHHRADLSADNKRVVVVSVNPQCRRTRLTISPLRKAQKQNARERIGIHPALVLWWFSEALPRRAGLLSQAYPAQNAPVATLNATCSFGEILCV
ncbi:unnamed protein product [Lota lota]